MVTREFIKQLRERNVDDGHVFFMNRYAIKYRIYRQQMTFQIQFIMCCLYETTPL